MENAFRFADELGPAKVVHIHLPRVGLRAVVVVDNVAAGPSIGGLRIAPDVSTEECVRLARAMTLKNAAAGLAHGGGKSVISADPAMPEPEKERLIRAFAGAVRDLSEYIPGPDMGTNERAMAWVKDEIGRAVGLPRELGGIPLDEIGATGFGLAAAAEVAEAHGGPRLAGARVAVQGFGAVGKHAARFLAAKGAILVAASDSGGTLVEPGGLDMAALIVLKESGRPLSDYAGGRKLDRDAIVGVDCDIWIPAARPDVLTAANVDQVKARLVIQGANIPVTPEAEARLHARGIVSIPDFVANAGGVICAAVEYHGGTQSQALATIEERIRANVAAVLGEARRTGQAPRAGAVALATERVTRAMALRRWA
jgi:glutamate dehydrogenase (NAD(P)+)